MQAKTDKIAILRDRAHMLSQVRHFFSKRNVLEVDCPLLISSPAIDAHIDPIELEKEKRFLHTSPEYAMKRLLTMGIGDIYQLSHVFRKGDIGKMHNPEFTMIEWYRLNLNIKELARETIELVSLFTKKFPTETLTFHEAFKKYSSIDPYQTTKEELLQKIDTSENWDHATLLDYLWASEIQPHLGNEKYTIITDYPLWQAELAKTNGQTTERFEIFFNGVELANGYHELTDLDEHRRRFEKANSLRKSLQKNVLPLDTHFLKALEKGLPPCCGVAVGFDRLMLLRHNAQNLDKILSFSWNNI